MSVSDNLRCSVVLIAPDARECVDRPKPFSRGVSSGVVVGVVFGVVFGGWVCSGSGPLAQVVRLFLAPSRFCANITLR